MPEAKPTRRVGVYARKSTPKQEDSIERQLAQVLPYCERNERYTVVGIYKDEGIAGDEFDRRPDFQRLLKDAKAGRFEVIVTDEWSRLSRQEPIDFIAKVVKPLKDAGVTLDCVAEGPQHWDDLAQLILMTVRADKSQGESKTRSWRTLTGMAKAAALGRLLGSHPPYGYLVEYETVQEPGKPPRSRPVKLVPDKRRAHVVVWLFERYAEGGWCLDDLARELNARGAPPPGRKGGRASKTRRRGEPCCRWTHSSVRAILKNPRYTGALVWNRRSRGKYHRRLRAGEVVKKDRPSDVPNAPEEWEVVTDTHEALVSQELFDRVHTRLEANRHARPSIGAYLFSGLLTCSHCGRTLAGVSKKGVRRYRCHKYDSAGEVVCGFNAVNEDWLLERVLRVLEQEVLAPERLEALRQEVRRQDEEEGAPAAVNPMQARLAELETWIAQGNRNLAILPSDRVPGVVAALRDWEQERDRLKAELARRHGGGNLEGLDEAIATCEALLWQLRHAAESGDALLLREVIREAIERIELTWERRPYGRRTRYILKGGIIHLRPQGECEVPCAARQTVQQDDERPTPPLDPVQPHAVDDALSVGPEAWRPGLPVSAHGPVPCPPR
jgi:DNA invertase Pin-like site-specific DNA recombinase